MNLMIKQYISILFIALSLNLNGQSNLDTAFNFTVKDIYGANIELFQLLDEGKFVVMDFFSPACGFCQLYAGDMQEAYLAHGENQGNIFFMGIGWGASIDNILDFMSQYGLTYPMVSGSQGGGNQLLVDFQIVSYPTIILIKPDRSISGELYIPYHPPTAAKIDSIIIASGAPFVGFNENTINQDKTPRIFPNPVVDQFEVTFRLDEASEVLFEIVDLNGRVVFSQKKYFNQTGLQNHQINIDAKFSGLYLLNIKMKNQQKINLKIMLE